ncbi:MAG: DUF2997 domain-containing protein [Verrucomicrobiota bacterium]
MKAREYEIVILTDGSVELTVQGHPGKSCLDVAKMFEEIIGSTSQHQLTQEFYEPDDSVHINQERYL